MASEIIISMPEPTTPENNEGKSLRPAPTRHQPESASVSHGIPTSAEAQARVDEISRELGQGLAQLRGEAVRTLPDTQRLPSPKKSWGHTLRRWAAPVLAGTAIASTLGYAAIRGEARSNTSNPNDPTPGSGEPTTVLPGGAPAIVEATATLVDTRTATPELPSAGSGFSTAVTQTRDQLGTQVAQSRTATPENPTTPAIVATPIPPTETPKAPTIVAPKTPEVKQPLEAKEVVNILLANPLELDEVDGTQKKPATLNKDGFVLNQGLKTEIVQLLNKVGYDSSKLSDAELSDLSLRIKLFGKMRKAYAIYPDPSYSKVIGTMSIEDCFNLLTDPDTTIPMYGYKSEEGDASEKATNPYDIRKPLKVVFKKAVNDEFLYASKMNGVTELTTEYAVKTIINPDGSAQIIVYASSGLWGKEQAQKQNSGGNSVLNENIVAGGIDGFTISPEFANGSTRFTFKPEYLDQGRKDYYLAIGDPNSDPAKNVTIRNQVHTLLYK